MSFSQFRKNNNVNIFDYITENLKIEEVVQRLGGLGLRRMGNELAGCCPSGHASQSGTSFRIITDKQFYFCHNCGISGNAFNLVSLQNNFTTKETIRWFIDQFNLDKKYLFNGHAEMSDEEKKIQDGLRTRSELLEKVVEHGKELLFSSEGKEVLDYLTSKRGYHPDNIKQTEFFYLPTNAEVKKYLHGEFPNLTDAINNLKLNGHFGDNFRLAFPYRNKKGMITGLLKRAIEPKGIDVVDNNNKHHTGIRWDSTAGTMKDDLFGLQNIKNTDTLLIVEGYPDAIYLPTLGYKNIVAIGQGKLGKKHLDGIKSKQIKNIILSLDNDKVGPQNTEAAIKLLIESTDCDIYAITPSMLSPHKDPDEYVKANGIGEFEKIANNAISAEVYMIENILKNYDHSSDMDKRKAINEAYEFGAILKSTTSIGIFIDTLIKKTKLTKGQINSELKKRRKKSSPVLDSNNKRYFPFIESATSSYAYYDKQEDNLHLGVPKEILEQVLLNSGQMLPENLKPLKAVFDVHNEKKIDLDKEVFNLFTPTPYLQLEKTDEKFNPYRDFPHINVLLSNLFPKYRERKAFLNWLAGIMQTRDKQLTAWVLKGKPGAGKGLMLTYILKPLFGKRQAIQVENEQLANQFNAYLQNVMMIAFNEVATDNKDRNGIKSKVKAIITDSEIQINEKQVKAFYVTNYANCLFYSNEAVPLLIEYDDRRFNVVRTGNNLNKLEVFNRDPEKFIAAIDEELISFAQFLMNYKYDSKAAKTVILNDEKEALVNSGMNRFEEFALHLKSEDVNWLNENQVHTSILPSSNLSPNSIPGKILKSTALQVFNNIHPNQSVNLITLGKHLKHYGIESDRISEANNRLQFFTWQN